MPDRPVKDASQSSRAHAISKRALIAGGVCIALVVATWFLLFPWLLRNRVAKALRELGVREVSFDVERATPWGSVLTGVRGGDDTVGVDRLVLDYTPADLWNGRIDAIKITGGELALSRRGGRLDLAPLTRLIVREGPPHRAATAREKARLLKRIDFSNSRILVAGEERTLAIPVDVTLVSADQSRVVVDARLGPNKNLVLGGVIDLDARGVTFEGGAQTGWTLSVARALWPELKLAANGFLRLAGSADFSGDAAHAALRVEVVPTPAVPAATTAAAEPQTPGSHDQPIVHSGIFIVTTNFGDKPSARLDLQEVAFALQRDVLIASGVSGEILFDQLAPPQTPLDQKLTARALEVGQIKASNGEMVFQMVHGNTLNIRQAKSHWLGGELLAQGIRLRPGEPIAIPLQLRDVDLKGLLELLMPEKAAGQGRVSGALPITIHDGRVDFGSGRITALTGGGVQIKDAAAIAPTAEAAAAAATSAAAASQTKRNIIEALSDFAFDRLSAQLTREDGMLIGYVRMSGKGRHGAQQPIDYELRVTGLEQRLRSYLAVEAELNAPHPAATTRTSP